MAPPTNIAMAVRSDGSVDRYQTADVVRETKPARSQPGIPARDWQSSKRDSALQELSAAVDEMNERARSLQRSLQFSIERELGLTVVRVVNPATDEVIRQIPSEEFVEKAKAMAETRSLLFDAEA